MKNQIFLYMNLKPLAYKGILRMSYPRNLNILCDTKKGLFLLL